MTKGLGRRARNVEELIVNMTALGDVEPVNYKPLSAQEGDVFITPWAKSGTTLMQQMFHQLRMGVASGAGDMNFDDISRVVPWEDTGLMVDLDLTAPQRAAPRGFKSHREYERLPAGMRYVVTLRDPKETYVSFYRFFDGWHLERGSVTLEDFFPLWMSGGPGGCDYFTHLLSWWNRRDKPDTFLATYRYVVSNRRESIERVAAFLDLPLTPALLNLVDEHTSRDFMHTHKDKFDDAMVCLAMEKQLGIPVDSDSTKVQAKGSDSGQIPQAVAAQIEELWAERIAPVTGHADFASLAAAVDKLER